MEKIKKLIEKINEQVKIIDNRIDLIKQDADVINKAIEELDYFVEKLSELNDVDDKLSAEICDNLEDIQYESAEMLDSSNGISDHIYSFVNEKENFIETLTSIKASL